MDGLRDFYLVASRECNCRQEKRTQIKIMNILVTGGSGFIGSNFIRLLLKSDPQAHITNLDKLTYAGNPENLKDVAKNKHYRFVKGDICNASVVDRLVSGVEAIVHFAAETHVDRSIEHAGDFIRTNVSGTFQLLESALKHRIKKFIHISTDEVYGSRAQGFFKETDPLSPSSPYSASKAASDLLALSYFVTYGLPVTVTRTVNNYGPYQFPEKVIPLFITNLLEGKNVPLYSRGENIRDWIFVEDNCRALDLVLKNGKPGEIYNISGESERTNLDLTKTILKKMNCPLSRIERVKDRPGHDLRYAVDCSKIKQLGFTPKSNFDAALEHTIAWYQNNPGWWKKLKSQQHK